MAKYYDICLFLVRLFTFNWSNISLTEGADALCFFIVKVIKIISAYL